MFINKTLVVTVLLITVYSWFMVLIVTQGYSGHGAFRQGGGHLLLLGGEDTFRGRQYFLALPSHRNLFRIHNKYSHLISRKKTLV